MRLASQIASPFYDGAVLHFPFGAICITLVRDALAFAARRGHVVHVTALFHQNCQAVNSSKGARRRDFHDLHSAAAHWLYLAQGP